MRYMMIVKHAENQGPVPKALMEAIGKLMEEDAKDGRTLIADGGLRSTAQGALASEFPVES